MEDQENRIQCRVCGKWFTHLHPNHVKTHLMSVDEYKRKYNVSFFWPKKAREMMSIKMGGARPYTARDKEEIVAELKKYAQSHKRLTRNFIRANDPVLSLQIAKAFGTWKNALKAADVRGVERIEWSADKIILALKTRQRKNKPLNARAISLEDQSLFCAIMRYFGGVEQALERIGVNYDDVRRTQPWDRETYGKELFDWYVKHGPLSAYELGKTENRLYLAARRNFGSLENAAKHYKIPFKKKTTRWSKERVAEELWKYHRQHGPLRATKIRDYSLALYVAMLRQYGSLRIAASELLIPAEFPFEAWSRENVIAEIQQRARENRSLLSPIVKKERSGLLYAATRHFGSWKKAKAAAGVGKDPSGLP